MLYTRKAYHIHLAVDSINTQQISFIFYSNKNSTNFWGFKRNHFHVFRLFKFKIRIFVFVFFFKMLLFAVATLYNC